jgi:hypothetical protein
LENLSVETLKLIQETAVEASGAEGKVDIVPVPGTDQYLVAYSGKVETHNLPPIHRGHELAALSEAVSFANKKGTPEKTVVWYDYERVVVILDDDVRRDRAFLPLENTPQYRTLLNMEAGKRFNKGEMIRFLRVEMDGCRHDDKLLNFARNCTFFNAERSGGTIQHAKTSMGRDIEQEAIADGDNCPEEVTFSLRVFNDPSLTETWPVRCAVELDIKGGVFIVTPFPLELNRAADNEVGAIGKFLEDGWKGNIFRGSP